MHIQFELKQVEHKRGIERIASFIDDDDMGTATEYIFAEHATDSDGYGDFKVRARARFNKIKNGDIPT